MQIVISSNADILEAALRKAEAEGHMTAVVEAEYGDREIQGKPWTLNHHVATAVNRPPPCTMVWCDRVPRVSNEIFLDGTHLPEVVGLSHLDLDTLGGVMVFLRSPHLSPYALNHIRNFWKVAGRVDLLGPHRLEEALEAIHIDLEIDVEGWSTVLRLDRPQLQVLLDRHEAASEEVRGMLQAWWAWSEANRFNVPRDGSLADAMPWVLDAMRILDRIFARDPQLLAIGQQWADAKEDLARSSFREKIGQEVVIRENAAFVNHLYQDQDNRPVKGVVGFNPVKGTVTVSLATPQPGVSCREIVQSLWGAEAGGHPGISGSPRNRAMTMADAVDAAKALERALLHA